MARSRGLGDVYKRQSKKWKNRPYPQFDYTGCSKQTYRLPLSTPWPEAKVDAYAELKAAHKAGKVIQRRYDADSTRWWDINEPSLTWKWPVDTYRIKPDVKIIPLEAKDVPPGSAIGYNFPLTGKWDSNAWEKCEKEAV
jgi:hypothetical protein